MASRALEIWRAGEKTMGLAVGKEDKLLERILSGTSDANIPFKSLCRLLHRLGFQERIDDDS